MKYTINVNGLKEIKKMLDVEAAIERTQGNKDLYYKLLRDFANQYGKKLSKASNDFDINQDLLFYHSLKGVAYNIGSKQIGDLAKRIEQDLKINTPTDIIQSSKLLNELDYQLNRLVSLIDTTIMTEDFSETTHSVEDNDSIEKKLNDLYDALELNSVDADRYLLSLRSYIVNLKDESYYETIYQAISGYDYEIALKMLDAMKGS